MTGVRDDVVPAGATGGEAGGAVVTHFVLTRFNVRMPIYEHPGDDWLPERVALFERYCLPTVRAQTSRAFRWLVFIDAGSPAWLCDRLEEGLDGVGEVVHVQGVFTGETAARAVQDRLRTPWVITTRLDNDDAVADDFVETIQAGFTGQQLEFLNLVSGAQYSRRRVYLRPYTRNPFISLVEAVGRGSVRGVFVRRHYELGAVGPVVNVRSAHPMWLQVVHGDNVLTELVGLRTRAGRVLPHFSCTLDVEPAGAGYLVEAGVGSIRILWRVLSRPRRLLDLAQVAVAGRPAGGSVLRHLRGRNGRGTARPRS